MELLAAWSPLTTVEFPGLGDEGHLRVEEGPQHGEEGSSLGEGDAFSEEEGPLTVVGPLPVAGPLPGVGPLLKEWGWIVYTRPGLAVAWPEQSCKVFTSSSFRRP